MNHVFCKKQEPLHSRTFSSNKEASQEFVIVCSYIGAKPTIVRKNPVRERSSFHAGQLRSRIHENTQPAWQTLKGERRD